jgi:membrane associated rhomboid family serine protease
MGIYDRDYYRREGPSFLGTFANRGQVCKWLVIVNIIAFILQYVIRRKVPVDDHFFRWDNQFASWFWLDVGKVLHGEVWRLLTYAFIHDQESDFPWHIIFNMLFLWWFGHELEEMYGHWEFLTFYLSACLLGGISFTLGALAELPGQGGVCLGASGGVIAVMVLFAFHFPRRTILLMFVLPVPIWALVVLQVLQDAFGLLTGGAGRVAVTVHLAGAGFAALYHHFQLRLTNFWPDFSTWKRKRSRPRLRVYREEEAETPQPVPVAASPAPEVDEQLEAKVDEVLAKVKRSGQASLTEKELQILMRASEVYKKRRS